MLPLIVMGAPPGVRTWEPIAKPPPGRGVTVWPAMVKEPGGPVGEGRGVGTPLTRSWPEGDKAKVCPFWVMAEPPGVRTWEPMARAPPGRGVMDWPAMVKEPPGPAMGGRGLETPLTLMDLLSGEREIDWPLNWIGGAPGVRTAPLGITNPP